MRHPIPPVLPRFPLPVLLGLLVLGAAAGAGCVDQRPATHSVEIRGSAFPPDTLTVAVGDTVVWINQDIVPHTVTAAGHWDSGSIAPGASWRYVAEREGTYPYACSFHPTMHAVLRVR